MEQSRELGYRAVEKAHAVLQPVSEPLLQRVRNSNTPKAMTGGSADTGCTCTDCCHCFHLCQVNFGLRLRNR